MKTQLRADRAVTFLRLAWKRKEMINPLMIPMVKNSPKRIEMVAWPKYFYLTNEKDGFEKIRDQDTRDHGARRVRGCGRSRRRAHHGRTGFRQYDRNGVRHRLRRNPKRELNGTQTHQRQNGPRRNPNRHRKRNATGRNFGVRKRNPRSHYGTEGRPRNRRGTHGLMNGVRKRSQDRPYRPERRNERGAHGWTRDSLNRASGHLIGNRPLLRILFV